MNLSEHHIVSPPTTDAVLRAVFRGSLETVTSPAVILRADSALIIIVNLARQWRHDEARQDVENQTRLTEAW